jgi:site-specific recombinase XerD
VTGGALRLEDRGVKHSNLKTGAPHEREAHQPVASSLDRGHVCPQVREKTQHDHIRHIETFVRFLSRSPDTATAEDLRRYQVHQSETGVQPPTVNSSAVALRFLFTVTLGRANLAAQLTRVHYPRRLPRVLSPEEVARLIEAAPGPGLKYKAAYRVSTTSPTAGP